MNAKPHENNSISTTEVAQIKTATGGCNRIQLIRSTCIKCTQGWSHRLLQRAKSK